MTATCIMVLGTTSGAGKSWLVTALCRWYTRQGYKVAPFKAQNMSNNARVVGGGKAGGEIGSAQYFQALASNAIPDVRMNPLLLKPEADTHSQVVLMGQVDQALTNLPWRERSDHVWPQITAALDSLRLENDIVIIEGAGSPAEINLMDNDIVNLRVARHAHARCLLVTDIDRGGAFAHLYGTWAFIPPADRHLIHGFVLNKFRGDAALLVPAPQMLEELTGIATVATLPMWREHGLPEEDGIFEDDSMSKVHENRVEHTHIIALITYPRISNLDEFAPLKNVKNVRLIWVRHAAQLANLNVAVDWIILPGSKNTRADLAWLYSQGLAIPITTHAKAGGRVLGICGGLQMLGDVISDPNGVERLNHNEIESVGLGLLPLKTLFASEKTVQHTTMSFGEVTGTWQSLSGVAITGYEIHNGHTQINYFEGRSLEMAFELIPQLAWCNAKGNVLGIYLHGLFENPVVLQACWGANVQSLDNIFDGIADFLDTHMQTGLLAKLANA